METRTIVLRDDSEQGCRTDLNGGVCPYCKAVVEADPKAINGMRPIEPKFGCAFCRGDMPEQGAAANKGEMGVFQPVSFPLKQGTVVELTNVDHDGLWGRSNHPQDHHIGLLGKIVEPTEWIHVLPPEPEWGKDDLGADSWDRRSNYVKERMADTPDQFVLIYTVDFGPPGLRNLSLQLADYEFRVI